jgi:uncharacterized protein YjiS (DUF1127 family)
MSNIARGARGTATWLNRAGSGNDLTTLSDRDLRDLGFGPSADRHQHLQVILVCLSVSL